jgi:hypothetical protein
VSVRWLLAAVIFTILACACGYAEDSPSGPHIIGFVIPGPDADPSLEKVLRESFVIQVARRRLTVQLADSLRPGELKLPDALSLASEHNAQYLVVATYTTTASECGLEVRVYDPARGTPRRIAKASGRIDLSLDVIVAQALARAFLDLDFRELPETPGIAVVPVTPIEEEHPRVERAKLLTLTAEAAPLFATGAVSQYAKIGFLATLTAGYRFPIGASILEAGLLAGACLMSATGAVTDAAILLVPIGLDLQYVINPGALPGIMVHLGGGPAVMNVNAGYLGDSLAKIVPYLLAGLTLNLPFTPAFGIACEARFVAFLEGSLPIMAFAPTVRVHVQL